MPISQLLVILEVKLFMNVDLDSLRNIISEEMKEASSQSDKSGNGFRILYPVNDGKIVIRLLYNLKAQAVQRRLIRHDTGSKGKIPCLAVYGEECPVCSAIKAAEDYKGKECGAFSKYGFKTRGICYAQIVDAPDSYLKGEDAYSKGDIVMFMYPKTVYEGLNKIMIESGEHLGEIVAQNNSIPVEITRSTAKGGYPSYTVSLYPYGASRAFDTEEIYEQKLSELPNLYEDIVPQYPNEDIRDKAKALSETINSEYIEGSVINPHDNEPPKTEAQKTQDSPAQSLATSVPEVSEPDSSDNPECFGCYDGSNRKCLLCMKEIECSKASKQ